MTLHLIIATDPSLPTTIDPPADIIIFPEIAVGGYTGLRATGRYYRPSSSEVQDFRTLSRRTQATCIAGTMPLVDGHGRHTNTSLVFHRGRLIHRYDKIHLFRPAGDDRFFDAGRSIGTFPIGNGRDRLRAGIVVCYDLRFPELVRFLTREGIAILFVPARWPAVRDEAWRTLLKARAIEGQFFTVGCNAVGEEGGASYVFGPGGELVFSSRDVPGAAQHRVVIDTDRVKEERTKIDHGESADLLRGLAVPRRYTLNR